MRRVLHQVLALISPAHSVGDSLASGEARSPSARERLREAIAARKPAEAAVQEAIAVTERVRGTIAAAEPAEDEARRAAKAAADSTRDWALKGAKIDMAAADQALFDQAAKAERYAQQARFKADGAQSALEDVEKAVSDARLTLQRAGHEIWRALIDVMAEQVEPQITALEKARGPYVDALASIAAIRQLFRSCWGPGHPLYGFSSGSHHDDLARRLQEFAIAEPSERDVLKLSKDWASFGKQLELDPDSVVA